ncbi:MAG: ADP-ribosylglycohydrolase family protein [Acidobacteriota bacterium]
MKTIRSRVAEDRCAGALVGLAVGNVLGLGFEGIRRSELRQIWPGGSLSAPLRELVQPWDDDLAMAMELAWHLDGTGGDVEPAELLQRYVRWYAENGRGIGNLTREVLELAVEGSRVSPAERVWRRRGGSASDSSAGNGAVMRVAPVGVRFRQDPERVVGNALADAALTHYDPLCQWTSAAAAVLVADMIEERVTPLDLFLPAQGCPDPTLKLILEEPPLDIEGGNFDGHDMGYTLHAWKVALWASHAPGDYQKLLQRVIRCGGDTDTNGAVAGAVLGARFGLGSIPAKWTQAVRDLKLIHDVALKLHRLGLPRAGE